MEKDEHHFELSLAVYHYEQVLGYLHNKNIFNLELELVMSEYGVIHPAYAKVPILSGIVGHYKQFKDDKNFIVIFEKIICDAVESDDESRSIVEDARTFIEDLKSKQ